MLWDNMEPINQVRSHWLALLVHCKLQNMQQAREAANKYCPALMLSKFLKP